MKKKKALIIGISGQDGAYLANLLLSKGYQIYGASRDAEVSSFSSLKTMGIFDKVIFHSMSIVDFRSVMQVIIDVEPDEIYNLGGQTSVALSFKLPVETLESISTGTLNILEVIRFLKLKTKFYNASSTECFGNTFGVPATESTPFRPLSPYAVAKSAAYWQVANYRDSYGLFACSGILSNHESPLRPNRFVTQKIVQTAYDIFCGKSSSLTLGNLSITRDWGWAPDYVEAMYLMMQQENPTDLVIATGKSVSLETFVDYSFQKFKLDYRDYLIIDDNFKRPSEIDVSVLDPSKAQSLLGWRAGHTVFDVIDNLVTNVTTRELA